MSRFHGPQPGFKTPNPNGKNRPKGVMRQWRAKLREEAEKRAKAEEEAADE